MTNQILIATVLTSFGVFGWWVIFTRRELDRIRKSQSLRLSMAGQLDELTDKVFDLNEQTKHVTQLGLKTIEDYKAKIPGPSGSVKPVQKLPVVSWVEKGCEHSASFKFSPVVEPWQPEFEVVAWRDINGVVFKVPRVTCEKLRTAGGNPARN